MYGGMVIAENGFGNDLKNTVRMMKKGDEGVIRELNIFTKVFPPFNQFLPQFFQFPTFHLSLTLLECKHPGNSKRSQCCFGENYEGCLC